MAPVSAVRGQSGLKQLKRTSDREREREGERERGRERNQIDFRLRRVNQFRNGLYENMRYYLRHYYEKKLNTLFNPNICTFSLSLFKFSILRDLYYYYNIFYL